MPHINSTDKIDIEQLRERPEAEVFSSVEPLLDESVEGSDESVLELKIAEVQASIDQRRRRIRYLLYLGTIFAVVSISPIVFGKMLYPNSASFIRTVGIGFLIYTVLGVGLSVFWGNLRVASMLQDLQILKAKRRIISRTRYVPVSEEAKQVPPTAEERKQTYFERLVDINVTNLSAYYGMVKFHANNSFLVTIAVACLGFALIAFGLLVGFNKSNSDNVLTYISTGAGVGTEFISGVFFYLYNRTVRQLKDYHDGLLAVQNVLLSFKIVGDTPNEADKVKMVMKMIEYLLASSKNASHHETESQARTRRRKKPQSAEADV